MMKIEHIIREFRTHLEELYGSRLREIILYGSWARGDATEDSDIDVMIVLEGKVSPGREIDRMIDIITDLNLKYNTLISVFPVSEEGYSCGNSPLLLKVRREGVVV
jgi:predicted nucleotidyltransferase